MTKMSEAPIQKSGLLLLIGSGTMTDPNAEPGWLVRVEETFGVLRFAPHNAQERACQSVAERDGEEAAAKLRELFEVERAKFEKRRVPEITAKLDAAEKEGFFERAGVDAKPKPVEPKPAGTFVRRSLNPNAKLEAAAVKVAVTPIIEATKPKPQLITPLRRVEVGRKYDWKEVVIPKGAGEIEALTYVPGLVGQIVEWIVSGARRPNRVMALSVALSVVGTLIGRRVEGPTGNATHLYVFILAPTGWGKDYPLWCGNRLMIAIGAQSLLGPGEFVSGRGIIKYLKRNPLTLCIVDELGDVFQLINGQQDNPWVTDLMGHFKKLYNSREIVNTAETMRDETVAINHPALTIVGACTAQALFEALKPRDIEGGFANRAMLLPFEGFKRPPERDVPEGAEEPPETLVGELKQLMPVKVPILDRKSNEMDVAPPVDGGRKLLLNLTKRSETMEKYHQGLRGLLENLSRKSLTCPLDVTGYCDFRPLGGTSGRGGAVRNRI